MLSLALHNANHWARGLRDSYDKVLHCELDTALLRHMAVWSAFQHVVLIPSPYDRTVRSLIKQTSFLTCTHSS